MPLEIGLDWYRHRRETNHMDRLLKDGLPLYDWRVIRLTAWALVTRNAEYRRRYQIRLANISVTIITYDHKVHIPCIVPVQSTWTMGPRLNLAIYFRHLTERASASFHGSRSRQSLLHQDLLAIARLQYLMIYLWIQLIRSIPKLREERGEAVTISLKEALCLFSYRNHLLNHWDQDGSPGLMTTMPDGYRCAFEIKFRSQFDQVLIPVLQEPFWGPEFAH